MAVTHITLKFSLGNQSSDAVNHKDVHSTAAYQIFAYFESLFCRIRLRNQQIFSVGSTSCSVARIQSMLNVNICCGASDTLGFCHYVIG